MNGMFDKGVDAAIAENFAKEMMSWNHPKIRSLPPESKQVIADVIASSISEHLPANLDKEEDQRILDKFNTDGFVRLSKRLTRQQVADIMDYFVSRSCYNSVYKGFAADDGVGRLPLEDGQKHHYGSYDFNTVMSAPHLLELFTSNEILGLVSGYLGAAPTLHSVNVFWSFPQPESHHMGQKIHRDKSHVKFCTLFVYLTDSDESSGAHEYFRHTHDKEQFLKNTDLSLVINDACEINGEPIELFKEPVDGYGLDDLFLSKLSSLKQTICGQAGEMFLENTYGLHRGVVPKSRPRLLAWARYSLHAIAPEYPRIERSKIESRLPDELLARYAIRAMVE